MCVCSLWRVDGTITLDSVPVFGMSLATEPPHVYISMLCRTNSSSLSIFLGTAFLTYVCTAACVYGGHLRLARLFMTGEVVGLM